jgi:hypothetical protein
LKSPIDEFSGVRSHASRCSLVHHPPRDSPSSNLQRHEGLPERDEAGDDEDEEMNPVEWIMVPLTPLGRRAGPIAVFLRNLPNDLDRLILPASIVQSATP